MVTGYETTFGDVYVLVIQLSAFSPGDIPLAKCALSRNYFHLSAQSTGPLASDHRLKVVHNFRRTSESTTI